MKNFDPDLLNFLTTENIVFDYYEHPPVFTVAESEQLKTDIPGMGTKNLFLTDRRGKFFLVCIEGSKRLMLNEFRKELGLKRLSFASPEQLLEILGLTPGSVTIFGLYNYTKNKKSESFPLQFFIDKDLREASSVGRHPNRNDATLVLEHNQIEKILKVIDVEVNVVEV